MPFGKILRFIKNILFSILLFSSVISFRADGKAINQVLLDSLKKQVQTKPAEVDSIIDSLILTALSQKDSFSYAKLLNIKGLAQRNTGKFADAIKSHNLAYDVFNLLGRKSEASASLSSIGIVMLRTAQYEEAKKYFLEALENIDKTDSVMLNVLYGNLGVAYDYTDHMDLAIETYKKALLYIQSPTDYYSMGSLNHNIGVCYSMLKDFKKSEKYEMIALDYLKKTESMDLLARIGISLGSLYLDNMMLDKAVKYYAIGGEAALKTNNVELELEYYTHMIELYITKKDPEKALLYFDKFNTLKSELYSKENLKNIAEAETKFNVALKNKEIENLKMIKNVADLKMQRARQTRNVMLVIILLSLVVLIFLYRNYKLRKRNLWLLAREKQLVESEKKALEKNNEYLENENMLARFEILKSQVSPHFLFNTLNALSWLIESDPEKAVHFTNAFSKLYRKILELKDQNLITLEQELNHVESYFFLQQTRFGENLKILKDINAEYSLLKLPPFSIQLAVENAINHNMITETEPLHVKLYCSENFLVIENNLQQKINSVKSTSIGIANIKSRYSFFTDTRPEFTKTNGSFIVKLPLISNN